MDTLENLLRTYGLVGVFFACALEGDLSLLLAGLLIHLGYFGGLSTYLVALIGMLTADIVFFSLGRTSSHLNWANGRSAGLLPRAGTLLDRFGPWALPVVRLFYGIRNVTWFLCGRRGWSLTRFLSGDVPGAVFWSALLIGLGYVFANSADAVFGHVKHVEQSLFASAMSLLIVVFGLRYLRVLVPRKGASQA